jgi:D-galactarolactone cycloisomerase
LRPREPVIRDIDMKPLSGMEDLGNAGTRLPKMRISSVRAHKLAGRLERRFGWSLNWTDRREATLVEVSTDAGLTGWGDGFYGGELLLRNPELVIGRSPFEVEAIYDDLRRPPQYQQRTGQPWCGGLDMALWDIVGQAVGQPVSSLLGRKYRSRVEPYCTALYRQDWPDLAAGLAQEALCWKARGFRTMKMKVGYGPDLDVRVVRAVREAIGDDTGLAVDANCAYDVGTAIALGRRFERFDLLWWEEPILADDLDGYARLRSSIRVPLAGGETFGVDQLMRDYVQNRLLDIVQPETEIVGLTGARRIAQLCWLNHVRMIPHHWGTAVRTAAILHLVATLPPLTEACQPPPVLFEFDRTESPFRDAVVKQNIDIEEDGCIAVPERPGLGIDVVREAVDEYRTELVAIG